MQIVSVVNLHKSYSDKKILRGVSFAVNRGEIFSLLGQNGAGKTTTLDIIEGLQHDFTGDVTIFGNDIKTHAQDIKRRIGVQLQATALLNDLSALEQVLMFAHLYRVKMSKAQAHNFLEQFQLADKANSRPDKLSGGEKQRLTLALALVNSPELLILDEPTANLDVQSRHLLWDSIRRWHTPDRAVILTTHYIEEAEKVAGRVGILHGGTLVALDTPQALIKQLDAEALIVIEGQLPAELINMLTTTTSVAINNGDTRIYTRNISSTITELVRHAEQLSVKLGNMRIQYPSLEDVFVSLTGVTLPHQQQD